MGIVERIKGLFGVGGRADTEPPEERQTRGDEELDIEAVQQDIDRDRTDVVTKLSDPDGR